MPVMDGVTAIKELRAQSYDKPIVALTANAMKEDREKCLAAGCDEYITKPVKREKLLQIVQQYLPSAESPQQITPILPEDMGDDPKLRELSETFIKVRAPEFLQKLTEAQESENWEEVERIMHQLKGIGGGVGYPLITELCGKAKFLLTAQNYAGVRALIEELKIVYARIVAGFSSELVRDKKTN